MRFIGDIHGKFEKYRLIATEVKESIQLGDFGIGFYGPYWHDRTNEFHTDKNHRFIRGNHDDPRRCREEMLGYIDDGTFKNDIMFIGGAWSIDHAWRVEGIDWWRDEELSIQELNDLIEIYGDLKPKVMVTHDAPTNVTYEMFVSKGLALEDKKINTRTGDAFQAMFEIHQPEVHFFGHWHHTKEFDYKGTHFHCLAELDYIDFDVKTMTYENRRWV